MNIEPIPLLRDNYAWLITIDGSTDCAVVDPSETEPVLTLLQERGLRLHTILATHHHWDHVNGIEGLWSHFENVEVVCSSYDYDNGRVPKASRFHRDGDEFQLFGETAKCMMVPGHTLGAMAFYFADAKAVFTGDTLFTAGCGRLFEGTPEQMYHSLSALGKLPGETLVYCGHEYTENNLNFAISVESDNAAVANRLEEVKTMRAQGRPTVPATIAVELESNPFMRADDKNLASLMGKESPVDVFAELRSRKDSF